MLVPTAYPQLRERDIQALGKVGLVIYGNHAIRAAVGAMRDVFARIRRDGGVHEVNAMLPTVGDIMALQGRCRHGTGAQVPALAPLGRGPPAPSAGRKDKKDRGSMAFQGRPGWAGCLAIGWRMSVRPRCAPIWRPGCWGAAVPQGVAFATLAGLPPEYGLYSAIMPSAVAALAGSSRHVMSGPTNANSLALFAVLAPLAAAGSPAHIQLALAVTVLVGLMQWLVGALRLGSLAHFISPSALFGFTSGAAVLIAVHALKDALGLPAPDSHGAGSLLLNLASHAGQAQAGSIIVTLATLGAALLVPAGQAQALCWPVWPPARWRRRPGMRGRRRRAGAGRHRQPWPPFPRAQRGLRARCRPSAWPSR